MNLATAVMLLCLLCPLSGCASSAIEAEAGAPADPSQAEVPLPAADGWTAFLVHAGDVGIWTVGTCNVFVQQGCPDIFGLDDKGRCTILASYSGKWTPYQTVHDNAWLGAFQELDLDPRRDGHEFYVGGKRGNLYQIRAYRDRTFDHDIIARFPDQEIHTAVGGDLLPGRPGPELLIFTVRGAVYDVRPADDSGFAFDAPQIANLDARVRQAVLLPAPAGEAPPIAAVCRSGELLWLRMTDDGLDRRVLLREPMGLGRLAVRPGAPPVLYVTRDDGAILRLEEQPSGAWTRQIIYAGAQGPRGLVAGRFDADPEVETLALFGYSRNVEMLRRRAGGAWEAETIFEDVDKGHWLAVAELDGRNATDEIIGSGYGKRIFLLSRPPGYGLDGVARAASWMR